MDGICYTRTTAKKQKGKTTKESDMHTSTQAFRDSAEIESVRR
jgi:hypothetical protein